MKALRYSVGSVVACLTLGLAVAAEQAPRLEPVGDRQGLATGILSTVFVDREGFLWTATANGLVRFDGYSKRVYARDPDDPTSLSDNIVRKIYEDRSGRLWLGTNGGGLNLLDRSTGKVTRFPHDPDDPLSISHDSVVAIAEDRDGTLWFGTQNGLNRFEPASNSFERMMDGESINAMHQAGDVALWIATTGGLVRRDPGTGEFTRFRHDPNDDASIDSDLVFSLAEDAAGRLWVGTQEGVNRLNRDGRTFRRFADAIRPFGTPVMVSALAATPSGSLWIGTFGIGLLVLDIDTGEIQVIGDQDGGPPDRVLALHATSDAVYGSTWGGGLMRIRLDAVPVETVVPDTGPQGTTDVSAIVVDRDGTVWLGVYGTGVLSRGPGETEFRTRDVAERFPYAIAEGQDGRLWYGGEGGLGRIDRNTGRSSFFVHDPEDPQGLATGSVTALLEDSEARLWVGTMYAGLQRMRSDGTSFDTFAHDPADPSSLGDDYITVLVEDRAGKLWVGTRSGGLNRCDRQTIRCVRYEPGADISAILEDRSGTLWIGTAGGGISRLDEDGFHRLGAVNGLPNDGIRGLAEDDDGSLWISTPKGLTHYDPAQGRTMALGLPDGLPSLDFLHGAATRGKNRIYFGTPKGLVSLPTGIPFPDLQPSPTTFTSIRSLRGPVPTDHPGTGADRLRVPYGEILSFEFAVLDFDPGNRHAFEYRLSGVTDEWVGMEGLRELTFTDLKPGMHTLSVRGHNARGVWSERSIDLEIVPPFWMTWWFRAGLLISIVTAAFVAYRLRVSALERRNRDLVQLHQELRTLTLRLEAAKEQERKRIARELHDEMGQGLSATKINLQTFPELSDEAARDQRLEDLVGQVDHMLQHVRQLSLDLSPPFLEEVGLTLAIEGYLESVAKRSGIEITVDAEPGLDKIDRDSTIHVFRLVQESITNVMRHSKSNKAIVGMRRVQDNLEITIRDEGCGFDLDDVLARSVRGQHLGLLGMRERAGAIGGEVTIDSKPGAGTEVRIRVPLALA